VLKKYAQPWASLLFGYDLLVVALSWLAAYYLRFAVEIVPITKGLPPLRDYLLILPVIIVIWAVSFRLFGASTVGGRKKRDEQDILSLLKASSFSMLLLMAVTFFYREHSYSRLVMLLFWCIQVAALGSTRSLVRAGFARIRQRGERAQRILVVGEEELGERLVRAFVSHPELGFEVVGLLAESADAAGRSVEGFPVLGTYDDVHQVVKRYEVDQVYTAIPLRAYHLLDHILSQLGEELVDVKVVPDFLKYVRLDGGVDAFEGMAVVNLSETPLVGWNRVLKRAFDIAFSLAALIVLSPIIGAVALLVKITSRGSVFYAQERMGMDGKPFQMYKFRSMRADAEEETGAVWADRKDRRCTPVGRIIRKTNLDEIPQLWNVLKGEMSIVGPRPERPVFVREFRTRIPEYMLRHKVKAGITGWAQVNGWRGKTSLPKRIECDIYYIENWSLLFDLRIMLLTLWKGLSSREPSAEQPILS